MIPKQLVGLRFNRVRFKDKKAFEKDWQNNPYSYEEIQKYFPKENYGIICGSDIRVLDDDTEKNGLIKIFIDNFGETFRVRDHLYFKFDDKNNKKIILMNGIYHLGEVQGEGTYVVGAGSTHPSGEIYEQKNNLDIITISFKKFEEIFGEYINNEKKNISETKYNYDDDDFVNSIKEKWTEGNRQELAMSVAGYLRKEKRLGLNSTLSIVEGIAIDCNDEEVNQRLAAVRSTYNKDENEIKGYSGLKQQEIKIEKPGMIFGVEGQAGYFIDRCPIFFDKSNIWWMWDLEEKKWEMCDETDILNEIRNDGVDTITSKNRLEIIAALKQLGRKNKPLEPLGDWIQFKDKIIDIQTGDIFDSTPKYFMTNPIPYSIGESEETPTLDKYFKEWVVCEGLQDESYVDTLYEMIAYSTMTRQFLQRLFAFVGSGSNGKGVYLSIIKKFLGNKNCCSTEMKLISSNNFESSSLYKKQMCEMGEVDAYDMNNTNMIKQLSGENDIRYCFKGKTPFTEKSGTTCFISTNSMPVTNDRSKGFYRRWLIIDFPHEFPVGKDILSEIPEIEFENLAKKSIRICRELLDRKKITNEGDVEERIKRYEDRSNPMLSFISDECDEDISKIFSIQDFVKHFNVYLKNNRLRPKNVKEVKKALQEEGFEIARRFIQFGLDSSKMNCILGLQLKKRTQKTHKDVFLGVSNTCKSSRSISRPSASFTSFPQEEEVSK